MGQPGVNAAKRSTTPTRHNGDTSPPFASVSLGLQAHDAGSSASARPFRERHRRPPGHSCRVGGRGRGGSCLSLPSQYPNPMKPAVAPATTSPRSVSFWTSADNASAAPSIPATAASSGERHWCISQACSPRRRDGSCGLSRHSSQQTYRTVLRWARLLSRRGDE